MTQHTWADITARMDPDTRAAEARRLSDDIGNNILH